MPYAPDLLLVNANVLTMDPARPRASAVAVAGGRIAGVGDDAAEAAGGARARDVLDLKGATLIPGFHDAHNHMIGFGLTLSDVDCRVTSLDELYARIAERASQTREVCDEDDLIGIFGGEDVSGRRAGAVFRLTRRRRGACRSGDRCPKTSLHP